MFFLAFGLAIFAGCHFSSSNVLSGQCSKVLTLVRASRDCSETTRSAGGGGTPPPSLVGLTAS